MKVIFVCLGNICRSPMAEAVMRQKIQGANLPVTVASAATSRWEVGNPPHTGTQKILAKYHVPLAPSKARQISREDFETADYIIGMDRSNVEDLLSIAPTDTAAKIYEFLAIVPDAPEGVPDPYYTGDFEETYCLVSLGTDYWLKKIQTELT